MSETLKPCPFCGKTPVIYAVGKVFRDHPGFVKCECVDGVSVATWKERAVEDALRAENEKLREALRPFAYECPYDVDEATVPKAGIMAAPEQVVGNMSVGWLRIQKAREALGEK